MLFYKKQKISNNLEEIINNNIQILELYKIYNYINIIIDFNIKNIDSILENPIISKYNLNYILKLFLINIYDRLNTKIELFDGILIYNKYEPLFYLKNNNNDNNNYVIIFDIDKLINLKENIEPIKYKNNYYYIIFIIIVISFKFIY